ncbi:MAG TPA: hypothetical protein VKH44_11975, partial [Pirellulaceae bacterium]|nr:hypothetical protein [Pirellulaceae bacterium]
MRRRLILVCLFGGFVAGLAASSKCAAREPFAEFVRGLQKRGYGEQALEYLDQIANRSDLPADVKESLDLERSKSLRIAANEAYDARQREARLAESKRLAEKFLTEHPTHPAAGQALLAEADDALARGEQRLALARGTRDKSSQFKAFIDARDTLADARSRFEGAANRLKQRVDGVASQPEQPKERANQQREELALPWIEARSKLALSDYLLAQTYSDPKDSERVKLLQEAGRGFNAVYQEYRGRQIGILAHMWHGKTLEELGDTAAAMDTYDEVLVIAPDPPDAEIDLAPLFGQAELFRLKLLATTAEPRAIIDEGDQWLQAHKRWQVTSPYQGIALEVARARLRVAEKARAAERTRLMRDSAASLAAIAKVESEHRQEALLLRRETIAKLGAGAALSLQEALTLGDEAAADRNWIEADALYRQALELAKKANDAKSHDTAKARLAQAIYRQAVDQYGARDLEKALALCGELVRDNPDSPLAEDASAVAVAAALTAYGDAEDKAKDAALARLDRVANYALGRWPDKPVADDSRMALAQAALIQGDYQTAQSRLGQVSTQSKRYSTALQVQGQVRWRQYLDAKKSPDAEARASEIAKLRDEAVTYLKSSLERQRASWQSASEPMPAAVFDTQLLLAEIYLEAQQWTEAAPLLEALVGVMKSASPMTVDRSGQRTLVGAVRAWLAMKNVGQAADATLMLIAISHDEEQPNGVLVELAKLVGQEIKRADTSTAPVEQKTFAAAPFADPLRDLHGRLIDALALRQSLTIPQLIYVGDACISLDRSEKAREIYERVLATIDRDASAKASAGTATTAGIRA